MGLSNKLSCEVGSLFHCHNAYRFFQSEVLRLYMPVLEPWVGQPVSLPSCSFWFIHMQMCAVTTCSASHYLTSSLSCHFDHPCPPALALTQIFSAQLPISAPPTILDECVFFISLVVELPYSLIFCQFWLFFIFNFFVILLLVVGGGTVYLPMPPSRLEVKKTCISPLIVFLSVTL